MLIDEAQIWASIAIASRDPDGRREAIFVGSKYMADTWNKPRVDCMRMILFFMEGVGK